MFTGLVEACTAVSGASPSGAGAILRVEVPESWDGSLKSGDSLAVNGVCLTVERILGSPRQAEMTVVAESLAKTTLGLLGHGDRVNLERPMALGGRLGGHVVQGHVDGVGTLAGAHAGTSAARGTAWKDSLSALGAQTEGVVVEVEAPPELRRYIVARGSVAVDGISLTVAELSEVGFKVALIPETLARTNAGGWRAGTRVNLEVDLIGRYVERLLDLQPGRGGA